MHFWVVPAKEAMKVQKFFLSFSSSRGFLSLQGGESWWKEGTQLKVCAAVQEEDKEGGKEGK